MFDKNKLKFFIFSKTYSNLKLAIFVTNRQMHKSPLEKNKNNNNFNINSVENDHFWSKRLNRKMIIFIEFYQKSNHL